MKKAGRKVDLTNINIKEIEDWIQKSNQSKTILKCHTILALHKGNQMKHVCNVMGVTRETVRLWKEQLRKGGVKELLKKGKVGKRSKLTPLKLNELKKAIKQLPENFDLEGKLWGGRLVMQYAQKKWKIQISIRTAYQWFNKAK
ncbi:MAG: hypothetical protein K8S00_14640 [Bacteroidales bacterium]|nr:hypothetical protein [Bacteroidales bacterium]